MEHIDDLAWKIATGLLAGLSAVLGWLGMRTVDRVEKCVSREELASLIEAIKADNSQAHTNVAQALDKINERVDSIWEHLAK